MNEVDVVILGAGPAGTAAAISLGRSAVVLEQRRGIGGLTGSLQIEGAIFDIGGHSFHTPHPEVRELVFSAVEMVEQKREARCYYGGSIIPYPFQKHFRDLPFATVVAECEAGLQATNENRQPGNLKESLLRRFGPGISKHFLLPYNRKLWGGDLSRLSADFFYERVATGNGSFETTGGKRKPLEDDTVIAYPARGGFGEILKALARRVAHIHLGAKVVRIDPLRKTLVTESGEAWNWQKLISTMPINELLRITDHVPPSLEKDSARLEFLSLKLILVVTRRPLQTEIQRIYVAEESIPAHKVVISHNSSDYLRALPHHAIMGEISYSSQKNLPESDIEGGFVKNVVDMGLLKDPGEVLKTLVLDVKYGYPVPTLNRAAVVRLPKEWLGEHQIHSIGRFGEWAYINSDEAIYRGLSLGRSIGGEGSGQSSRV